MGFFGLVASVLGRFVVASAVVVCVAVALAVAAVQVLTEAADDDPFGDGFAVDEDGGWLPAGARR